MMNKFRNLNAKITRRRLNPFIKKYSTSKKTLDIGCAPGSSYEKEFPNRIKIDILKSPNVDYILDVQNMNQFKDNEFDCIICSEVLEHVKNPKKAINEMYRVLKKNGILILTTRFIFPLHDTPNDYYRFTKYGLIFLLKDFKILELKEEANTLETIGVLFQRIGFQCKTLRYRFFNIIWYFLYILFVKASFIITKNYGSPSQKTEIKNILSSGYYVACRK